MSLAASHIHSPHQEPPGHQLHVPEKVPEKTPGAWLTKLSMTAPGLRERALGAGLLLGEEPPRILQSTCRDGWGNTGSAQPSAQPSAPKPQPAPPEPGDTSRFGNRGRAALALKAVGTGTLNGTLSPLRAPSSPRGAPTPTHL